MTEALLPVEGLETIENEQREAIVAAAAFAQEQIAALAIEHRFAVWLGLACFHCSVSLRYGRSFRQLSIDRRRTILRAWAFGRWSLGRQLFRPIRTTALIAYYSRMHQ